MPGAPTPPYTLDQIREFWTAQAKDHQQDAAAWSDRRVMELEVREILPRLSDGDRVLDVGCANGYSTVQFASQKRIALKGVDYIPEMIEHARLRLAALSGTLRETVEFAPGDITSLEEPSGAFDKVVCIRVLINLGDGARQRQGLAECARVLKPLLARALGGAIDPADPEMEWNRWFAQIPAWGDYGTQKLFVLTKS